MGSLQESLGGPVLLTPAVYRSERVCAGSQVTKSSAIIYLCSLQADLEISRGSTLRALSCNGAKEGGGGPQAQGAETIIEL
jgi:hypothetical protein